MKAVVALLVFVLFAQATHFRYGTTSFTKSTSNPRVVTVTFNLAMRRSYAPFNNPNQGSTIQAPGTVYCGNTGYNLNFVATSVDLTNDIVYATGTQQWTLGVGTTYCYFTSNARISNLNNNADGDFRFGAYVVITQQEIDTLTINNGPVSGLLPIVAVAYNQVPFTYQIVASDPEGNALTFRQSTQDEMKGTQPPGLTVSSSGLVTISSVLALGFWSTQQTIIDSYGNIASVDYLLNVSQVINYCSGSCSSTSQTCTSSSNCVSCGSCLPALPRIVTNNANSASRPRTNLPANAAGSTYIAPSGQTTVLSYVVDDQNLYTSTIVISTSGLPTYATPSQQTACNSASSCSYVGDYSRPQLVQITLQPTQSNEGTSSTICVGAKSNGNSLANAQHCITVTVPVIQRQVCGNGAIEGTEQCDGGACCTSACRFATSSTTCRGSNGPCDVAETCSGSSSTCPADSKAASGLVCRGSNGPCDEVETCDGNSDSCPADSKIASGVTCRASNGPCDEVETCDGNSDSCPADSKTASGTLCRASNGPCDMAESCDGSSDACPADSKVASGTTCRSSNGVCDAAESCDGSSDACPADSKVAAGTTCRLSNGVCDAAESCDGSSDACPADSKIPSGRVCRAAVNKCDVAESCDGSSDACPADALSNTAECFCGRQSTDPKAYPDYFCVPGNSSNFFMCVYGAWAPQSREMSCARGTECGCPADGTECSCSATRSPCVWAGQTQNCN